MRKQSTRQYRLPVALNELVAARARERKVPAGQVVSDLIAQAVATEALTDQLRVIVAGEFVPMRDAITSIERRSAELLQHFDDLLQHITGTGKPRSSGKVKGWRELIGVDDSKGKGSQS